MDIGAKLGGTHAWSSMSGKGSSGNMMQHGPLAYICKVGLMVLKCSELSGLIGVIVRKHPITEH